MRVAAFLVDAFIAILAGSLLALTPFVGSMLGRMVMFSYILMRDITGASIGKRLFGLRVVLQNGSPSTANERIVRNLTIAIGPAVLLIPLASDLGPPIWAICIAIEGIVLLIKGERLGDMFNFTAVERRRGSTPAVTEPA